jgi:transcription factor SPN1
MSSSLAHLFDSSEDENNEPKIQTIKPEQSPIEEEIPKENDDEKVASTEEEVPQEKLEPSEEYESSSDSGESSLSEGENSEESKSADEEEFEEKSPHRKRGAGKIRKSKENVENEDEPPEVVNEKTLEARKDFQEAMARVTPSGGRRRRQASGDGVSFSDSVEYDDFAVALRNKMDLALKRDIQSMNNGKTALERHKLLPQVISALNRRGLQDILLENGILSSIREWLEPVKTDVSCTLPGINLRKPLLETLKTLPIDTSSLRESGIGRIVYFFSKRDDEASDIRRISSELVIKWSQPIISSCEGNSPSDYSTSQNTDFDASNNEKHLESEKYIKLKHGGDTQSLQVSQPPPLSVYHKLAAKKRR